MIQNKLRKNKIKVNLEQAQKYERSIAQGNAEILIKTLQTRKVPEEEDGKVRIPATNRVNSSVFNQG